MNTPLSRGLSCLFFAGSISLCNAAVVNLIPGSNNIAIEQLTLLIGGVDVVQNTEASSVIDNSDTAVNVKSVRITDGGPVNLTFFNTEAAAVVNVNPEFANIANVGVFDNGVYTPSNAGVQAYGDAFAATSLDTDLRNFGYYDFVTPTPTAGVPDLDLLFYRALNLDDYMLVCERWGNSYFEVTALMADGKPYASANVLRIGGPGGTPNVGFEVHDWNTGYAAATNVPTQAQALTLFSVKEFFEGTQAVPGPIYGFRIDNDDQADVKFIGISDNPFTDNPVNPQVVPEPSSLLMLLAGGVFFLGSRKRARMG